MGGDAAACDQAASGEEQDRAGSIQGCVKSREEGILLGDHAAGLVLLRFAISRANPNMISENKASVAIADASGKMVSAPGYISSRSAATPYVKGFKRMTT